MNMRQTRKSDVTNQASANLQLHAKVVRSLRTTFATLFFQKHKKNTFYCHSKLFQYILCWLKIKANDRLITLHTVIALQKKNSPKIWINSDFINDFIRYTVGIY